MQYARVVTPVRDALVALEPTNWGAPCQALFDQTDVSGWELWHAYSHNNFNNPLQAADEVRYNARGSWAVILRDVVREGGRGEDDKGRLNVDYVSLVGTEWEQTHKDVWSPKNGWYVPTSDGIFHEGTLIPFETVQDKKIAIKRCEAKGIPPEQVSYFWRFYKHGEKRFLGRHFYTDWGGGDRFDINARELPSDSGYDFVASLQACKGGKAEIVMEVDASQIKATTKIQ